MTRTRYLCSWGNYSSEIKGGTGKFAPATGRIDYFGIADFKETTLVLRYKGRYVDERIALLFRYD